MSKKIAIGCDHAGFEYKEAIKHWLTEKGFEIQDFGTDSLDSVDYPDFVHPLAISIENKQNEFGILICGSGNGVNMTANKYSNVRSALCWQNEIAELSRQHNDANVIALPARYTTLAECQKMINTFISTKFEGGRHQRRVDKIASC